MYHAILAEGELQCERYEQGEHGVDLYDGDGEHMGFVPYSTLQALVDDEVYTRDDPALM